LPFSANTTQEAGAGTSHMNDAPGDT
jgi:hypothetical protein